MAQIKLPDTRQVGSPIHSNNNGRRISGNNQDESHASDTRGALLAETLYTYPKWLDPRILGSSNSTYLEHYDFNNSAPPHEPVAASFYSEVTPVESPPQSYFIQLSSAAMSLAYENRGFAEYPQSTIMDDPTAHDHNHNHNHMHHQQRYPSPPAAMSSDNPYAQIDASLELQMQDLPQQKEDDEETGSPRAAALAKPIREIVKDEDGRYVCTWAGCTEEVRNFGRKCEWNKHMDKHDRPYKCGMDGCEKIPGFTYSGGLLRHQREVHNLHGGPRKQLNCPHPNCKRNSGKGFSRQENLNEHLRRVHTTSTVEEGEMPNTEELEEEPAVRAGTKRKRVEQETTDVRVDMARVIQENESLRLQVDMQSGQIAELMRQLSEVQAHLNSRLSQVPQAIM